MWILSSRFSIFIWMFFRLSLNEQSLFVKRVQRHFSNLLWLNACQCVRREFQIHSFEIEIIKLEAPLLISNDREVSWSVVWQRNRGTFFVLLKKSHAYLFAQIFDLSTLATTLMCLHLRVKQSVWIGALRSTWKTVIFGFL